MRLLLDILKRNIASEVPVRVNELFQKAFYDPGIWRKQAETMQQYIARREQDFKRPREVLSKCSVPEQVQTMMLMTFAGLDRKVHVAVLSSRNNKYDFEKLGHARGIQFLNSIRTYVHKRDLLGWGHGRRDAAILGPSPVG